MTMETRPFQELFPKESLVYLTADSPNILQTIEDGKVYIIGGLVDRNRHKVRPQRQPGRLAPVRAELRMYSFVHLSRPQSLCYNLALEQGIAHAQLPIGDVLDMKTRKVLAVNHGAAKRGNQNRHECHHSHACLAVPALSSALQYWKSCCGFGRPARGRTR